MQYGGITPGFEYTPFTYFLFVMAAALIALVITGLFFWSKAPKEYTGWTYGPFDQQKVLDFVTAHLLMQNAKAQDATHCQYRAEEGRMCAVGCLIPDNLWNIKWNTQSIYSDAVNSVLSKIFKHELNDAQKWFLYELQAIHDTVDVARWSGRLAEVAEKHNLIYRRPHGSPAHIQHC